MWAKRGWDTGISAGWRWTCLCSLLCWQNRHVNCHEDDRHSHLGPAEMGDDKASCRPHSGVVDGVQRLENRLPHLDQGENPVQTSPIREAPPTIWDVICRLHEHSFTAFQLVSKLPMCGTIDKGRQNDDLLPSTYTSTLDPSG
jgi:hypothetical protein